MARRNSETAKRDDAAGASARPGDAFAVGLRSAIGDLRAEVREHDAASEPAAVLRLPVRNQDQAVAPPEPDAIPEAVTEAIAPLVEEVGRLRAEIARMRKEEAPVPAPADAPPVDEGVELVKLLAGVMACFILVAIALVIVVKA